MMRVINESVFDSVFYKCYLPPVITVNLLDKSYASLNDTQGLSYHMPVSPLVSNQAKW